MIMLHEAGFINVLRTLAWIVLIYYAVKFLARLFAPYLMKKTAEKIQKKMEEERTKYDVKEGETVIDKKPNQVKETNKSIGEYVDFEEID